MTDVMALAQEWPLTPLEGGAVDLPLEALTRLASVVCAGGDAAVAVSVGAPDGPTLHGEWERTCMEPRVDGGAVHFRLDSVHNTDSNLLHRLGVALKNSHASAGTAFELASHAPRASWACQRYRGEISGDTLRLLSSYPGLRSDTLRRALELFRQGEEGQCLTLVSEEVAAQVFRAAKDSLEFGDGHFVLEGSTIRASASIADEPAWLTRLAGYAMLRSPELATAWNLQEALRTQEAELAAAANHARTLVAQYTVRRAQGPQRDVIYAGKHQFSSAQLTELPHILSRDEEDMDTLLGELGFASAGGLLCLEWFGAIAKGYTRPGGEIFALIRADLRGRFTLDFRTSLPDGGEVLTSTRADEGEDQPGLARLSWLRHSAHPLDTPAQLLAHHRQALEGAGAPQPVESLEAIARALDRFMIRAGG